MRRTIPASLFGVLLCSSAYAGWAVFQVNGPNPLPPGVALHAIDGGPTYMADNGLSNATASFIWNGITYNGMDDPRFFQIGPWNAYLRSSADATAWVNLGFNSGYTLAAPTTGQFGLAAAAGLRVLVTGVYLGIITQNAGTPGAETVGIYPFDEPIYAEAISAQIQGNPATTFTMSSTGANASVTTTPTGGAAILGGFYQYAGNANNGCPNNSSVPSACMLNTAFLDDSSTGAHITPNTYYLCTQMGFAGSYQVCSNGGGATMASFAAETVTQIALPGFNAATQDGRFIANGMAGLTFLHSGLIASAGGNITGAAFFGQQWTAPSGKKRHQDLLGFDLYHLAIARSQNTTWYPGNQSITNVYDTSSGSPALTMDQAAVGAHYGDMIDIMRSMETTYSVPNNQFIETGNCICNISQYVVQPVEMAWAAWANIIHGARGMTWFDNDDSSSVQFTGPENIYSPYYQNVRSVTVTGSISCATFCTLTASNTPADTVPGQTQIGFGILAPGMVCTSGCTGATRISQQLTFPTPATFTGVFSGTNKTVLTVSGVTGTITVPSFLTGPGTQGTAFGFAPIIQAGTGPTYTVSANSASPSGTITANPSYGGQGTYKLTGTPSGSGTMTFQQQFARGNNTPTAMSMTGALTEIAQEIRDMAPVINSPFAYGYVSVTPPGYRFQDGMTQVSSNGSNSVQSYAHATGTGIEVMAKFFQGTAYPASSGETISGGFYIFADTRFPESTLSATIGTVTYTLGTSGCNGASVATVIGESRTRPISGCQFTDTFNNAWTYHIYQIQ
jgi:hypothetical protein